MRLRTSFLAVLLALATALGVLTGCGSDDVGKLLSDTFGSSGKPTTSGRIDLGLKLDLHGSGGLSGPVEARLTGPFKSEGRRSIPQFDFAVALGISGRSFRLGATSTGDKGYLRFQDAAFVLPDDVFAAFKRGFEQDSGNSKDSNTTFASLGIDPRGWLKDPEKKGEEKVGGVETVHIKAGIDVPSLLKDINQILGKARTLGIDASGGVERLSDAQRAAVGRAVKSPHFDVWTGKDDHVLRKLRIAFDFDVAASDRDQTGGLESGKVELTLLIDQVNKPQTITAPKGAHPFAELTQALRGALGTSGGGTGNDGSSGSGSSNGQSQSQPQSDDPYTQCLIEAQGDIRKQQQCAPLLQG
jgi:hypothetical protein